MFSKLESALLTVEEASTLWCPEARTLQQEVVPTYPGIDGPEHVNTAPASCNRASLRNGVDVSSGASQASLCLGDACMFWRWHDRFDRPQPSDRVVGYTLNNDVPLDAAGRTHTVWVERLDNDYLTIEEARETLAECHGVILDKEHKDYDPSRVASLYDETPVVWLVSQPDLPPRGYCGRAGHPLQSDLVARQLELLAFQIHDHNRVA